MENQFDGFLSQSSKKGEDEGRRPTFPNERRSSFVAADALYDSEHPSESSERDGPPRGYTSFSMGPNGGTEGNSITMTPTTQFLEQPVIFNVNKGEHPASVSGQGTSQLDDLLVDLKYSSPHMLFTCGGGLAGFVLGTILNRYGGLSTTAQLWIGLPGYLFTFAIQCITLPLIFTSVTICFANLILSRKTKGVMVRMLIYFVMASFLAACVALGVAFILAGTFSRKPDPPEEIMSAQLNLMCPNGKYLAINSSICEGKQLRDAMEFTATNITGVALEVAGMAYKDVSFAQQIVYFFDNLFAQNVTEAFYNGAFLAVSVFSVLFGAGLVLAHDPTSGEQNHAFVLLKQVDLVLEMILNWMIPWTPLGTFSAMTYYIMSGTVTQSAFRETMYFTIAMAMALVVYFVLVTCVGYFVLVRKNPFQFFWYLMPAMIFMFGSSDYTSTIPVLMRSIEGSKQVSRTLSQFTVCMGVSLSLSGTAAYFVVATIYMAYTSGIEDVLTPGRLIGLVILATLSSIGTPHQAGVGLTYLATLWRTLFGTVVPASFAYLILIEWLIVRFRRTQNIIMIAFIARVIAEQLDETVEDEEDRAYAERQIGLAHM